MRALVDHCSGLDSPLHRLHPVCKWLAFGVLAVATVSVVSWQPAATSLALALLMVLIARIPMRLVAVRVGAVAAFLTVFVAMTMLIEAGSPDALRVSMLLAAKCLAVVAWTTVLLGVMPTHQAFSTLRDLRVPARIVEQLSLAYRYTFAQAEEFSALRRSAVCRGFRPSPSLRDLRTAGRLSGALIVRGLDRSRRIHEAMIARGYVGEVRALASSPVAASDIAKLLGAVAIASVLLATRWMR